jgi:hypothetical protein
MQSHLLHSLLLLYLLLLNRLLLHSLIQHRVLFGCKLYSILSFLPQQCDFGTLAIKHNQQYRNWIWSSDTTTHLSRQILQVSLLHLRRRGIIRLSVYGLCLEGRRAMHSNVCLRDIWFGEEDIGDKIVLDWGRLEKAMNTLMISFELGNTKFSSRFVSKWIPKL